METTVGGGAHIVNRNPILIPDGLYLEIQIMELLGISQRTLYRWRQAGLKAMRPGTEKTFYYGRDVIEIMRLPAESIPEYCPEYKQKKGK